MKKSGTFQESPMLRILTLAVAVVLVAVPALAQEAAPPKPPANPLATVTAFQCTFVRFSVARWDQDVPEILTAEDNFSLGVAGIDLRRSRARVVSATATVDVSARLAPTGLNIIEQTPAGNFVVTTIFSAAKSADTYYAVHSRHLGDLTTPPSVSQYYGTCQAGS
jgi:hypothetical protein